MDDGTGRMAVVDRDSRGGMRASDTDREQVAEQLRRAQSEGRLDLTEYDERVQQAFAARTYGELDRVTADLPEPRPLAPIPAAPAAQARRTHGDVHGQMHGRPDRRRVAAWAAVSIINVAIWGIISLATFDPVFPWWIFVAGPWGAVLLARYVAGRIEGGEGRSAGRSAG